MTNTSNSETSLVTETIFVKDHRVSCDGGGGALGHPKVYMDMGQADRVKCKYCDKMFVLKH